MSTAGFCMIGSPVGSLFLAASAEGVCAVDFLATGAFECSLQHLRRRFPETDWREDAVACAALAGQLQEYFTGRRRAFSLPLALRGTPFQVSVWEALCRIPFGRTSTYRQVAAAIGRAPVAARAVGGAVGGNPLPVVVPCHRVIGSDGTLTGFGGGLPAKRWLLAHEGALVA